MAKDLLTIQQEFQEALGRGAPEGRAYLVDHVKEFPEDLQEEVIYAFFVEGLDQMIDEQTAVNEFQEEAVQEMKQLERLKGKIEDKIKMKELEGKLDQ